MKMYGLLSFFLMSLLVTGVQVEASAASGGGIKLEESKTLRRVNCVFVLCEDQTKFFRDGVKLYYLATDQAASQTEKHREPYVVPELNPHCVIITKYKRGLKVGRTEEWYGNCPNNPQCALHGTTNITNN